MVIKQSSETALMAEKVKGLYELRRMIAQAQEQERDLTKEVKDYMAEEGLEELDFEGAPPCVLKSRSTGLDWDSHAISTLIDKRPQEWRKLVELGAVKLSVDVLKKAIANGQLAGLPTGGVEGTTEYLTFEDKR